MPPIFEKGRFNFKEGQEVPAHVEKNPGGRDRDQGKYAVVTELIGANLFFPTAIDIDDLATAELLAGAHRTEDGIGNSYVSHVIPPLVES